jgi:hypothetical protein
MWRLLVWLFILDKDKQREESIADRLADPWYKHPVLPHVLGFFVILAIGLALMACLG